MILCERVYGRQRRLYLAVRGMSMCACDDGGAYRLRSMYGSVAMSGVSSCELMIADIDGIWLVQGGGLGLPPLSSRGRHVGDILARLPPSDIVVMELICVRFIGK